MSAENSFYLQDVRARFSSRNLGITPVQETGMVPHDVVQTAMDLSRTFLVEPTGRKYLERENRKIANGLSTVDGFAGACGVGFPYNAPEGPVPEITDFLSKTKTIIDADREMNPHGWGCPDCQVRNNLPDLKTQCKPCTDSVLKPRDVFKALPDIDMFVVTDTISPDVERQVEEAVGAMGYTQSDTNILNSVLQTSSALEAINRGDTPPTKLPIDIHVISKDNFFDGMDRMTDGDLGTAAPMRSLHTTWEDDNIPFGFDFIFSLTPLQFGDQETLDRVRETRATLMSRFGEKVLVDFVRGASPRAERLMKDEAVRINLKERIAAW